MSTNEHSNPPPDDTRSPAISLNSGDTLWAKVPKGRSTRRRYAPVMVVSSAWEGRRGSSAWQRRRLLSDVLVAVTQDLRDSLTYGLPLPVLAALREAVEKADSAIALVKETDAGQVFDSLFDNYADRIKQLERLHGNGPASIQRSRVLNELASSRRSAAKQLRLSESFAYERLPLSPINDAVEIFSQLAQRYPDRLVRVLAATQRFQRRSLVPPPEHNLSNW